jgi:hypothetical protein
VALWWAILLAVYFALNASPVIVLVLAAISLPALYDIGAGSDHKCRNQMALGATRRAFAPRSA